MEYGLIGENLSHSFSKFIHSEFNLYNYNLYNLSENELDVVLKSKKFKGLNITIPYKKSVIKYCDVLDETVKKIGSANTLVIKNDRLKAYNTDYFGLKYTMDRSNIFLKNKKVMILGSGGTSLTARALAEDLGASEIITVSRSLNEKINYSNIYDYNFVDVLINTTPVGMYPNNLCELVDISKFKNLSGVVDVIYNPLKSKLLMESKELKIPIAGGLPMLVAQAKASAEIFSGERIDDSIIEKIIKKLCFKISNIVLVGMPGCGKTTLSKILSDKLSKKFVDTDQEIQKYFQEKISKIFEIYGEEKFREAETEIIKKYGKENNLILSTGGGAVVDSENYYPLKQNSRIYWIKRDLNKLDTKNRPLSKNLNEIKKIYESRKLMYENFSDKIVLNNERLEDAAQKILEDFYENIDY